MQSLLEMVKPVIVKCYILFYSKYNFSKISLKPVIVNTISLKFSVLSCIVWDCILYTYALLSYIANV